MMFSTNVLSALVAAACASFVAAAPTPGKAIVDIVYDPMITAPTAGATWTVGSIQLVTWNTDILPQGSNETGSILLGYQENGSENLDLAHPLATAFQLTAGEVNVTVPDVIERDDYIIILFGDSGNASGQFTIVGGSSSATSSASAVSSATSVASSAVSSATSVAATTITSVVSSATSSASSVVSSA